jgi:uncharacterized repeat protein (TIGR01451 family)
MKRLSSQRLLFLTLFFFYAFLICGNPQFVLANDQSTAQTDNQEITSAPLAGIKLTKHLKSINDNPELKEYSAVGDKLVYEIRIVNSTNNVRVHQLQVLDSQAKTGPSYVAGDKDGNEVLDPQETWIYEASYLATQEDLDRGSLTKSARATGVVEYTDDETVIARQGPAVKLTKTVNEVSYFAPGDLITFNFTIQNVGNVTLHDIEIIDPLPGVELTGGVIKSLKPGESDTTTFTAKYTVTEADIEARQITNTAEARAADPNNNPVVHSSSVTLEIYAPQADLSIEKQLVTTQVIAGKELEYRLFIINHGPDDASEVIVKYLPPAALSNVHYSINPGEWLVWPSSNHLNLGNLANGAEVVINIRAQLSSLAKNPITGKATVTAFETDPFLSNNNDQTSIPLNIIADLVVTTTGPETITAGEDVEYILTVTNLGPSAAEKLCLEAIFDANAFIKILFSADNGASWQEWTGEYCYPKANLDVGKSFQILIKARVINDLTAVTVVSNQTRVKSDTFDPDLANNVNSLVVPVPPGTNQPGSGNDNDPQIQQPSNPLPVEDSSTNQQAPPEKQPSDNAENQEPTGSAESERIANRAQNQLSNDNDQSTVEKTVVVEGEEPRVQPEMESVGQSEEVEQVNSGDGGDGKNNVLPKTAGLALASICALWFIILGSIALKKGYPKGYSNR